MKVLLVEDDDVLAAQLGHVIRAMDGAELVHAAVSDEDACEWMAANPEGWDLALVDVFLAAGHGFNVLRQCANRSPRQRVALMSSYTREPMRERALEAGADAFFDKTDPERLIDFCIDLLKSRRTASAEHKVDQSGR
jgi:DNA-binding NarL/FixJ family response regulator